MPLKSQFLKSTESCRIPIASVCRGNGVACERIKREFRIKSSRKNIEHRGLLLITSSPGVPQERHFWRTPLEELLRNFVGIAPDDFCRNSSWGIQLEFWWKRVSRSVRHKLASNHDIMNLYSSIGSSPGFYSCDG